MAEQPTFLAAIDMKHCATTILILLFIFPALAQPKYTLSGYIRDSLSGESLIGATIAVNGQGKSISSNQYGFYSITLPQATYTIYASFAGYQPIQMTLALDKNLVFNFHLLQRSLLEEVVVSSRRRDGNVQNAQMGKIDLSINQVKAVPVLLGEVDLLKTLQLMPGVRNAGEGNTGLYVRGVVLIKTSSCSMMPLYTIPVTSLAFSPSSIPMLLRTYPLSRVECRHNMAVDCLLFWTLL